MEVNAKIFESSETLEFFYAFQTAKVDKTNSYTLTASSSKPHWHSFSRRTVSPLHKSPNPHFHSGAKSHTRSNTPGSYNLISKRSSNLQQRIAPPTPTLYDIQLPHSPAILERQIDESLKISHNATNRNPCGTQRN